MVFNKYGKLVGEEWLRTEVIRPNVELDEYVIMPNHIHGIIKIHECEPISEKGTLQRAPTVEGFCRPTSNSIPTIVRLFKSTTTKQINKIRGTPGISLWQRNYYEHIIRNERSLKGIREYIVNNPINWALDPENPDKPPELQAQDNVY